MPPISITVRSARSCGQQRLADADRVGDDDQLGDVGEPRRQVPRGRAGGEPDRRARSDEAGRSRGDRLLLGGLLRRLGEEARLQGRRRHVGGERRTAVHLGEQALPGEGVEVATDRHVADTELARQLADAHRAVALDVGGDQLAAAAGEDATPGGRGVFDAGVDHAATIGRSTRASQQNRAREVCDDGDSWSILGSLLDFTARASESDGREHLTAAAEQRSTSWGDYMPRSTPRRSPAPSQFPNSSVNQFSRRQLLAGAGAALGTGAVLAGLGSSGVAALSQASPRRWPSSSGEPVTFGSNYSDDVPKRAIAGGDRRRRASRSTINTVDHNTYQENFNTYIQQPDDVVSWFAGYRMRAFAAKGRGRRHLRRVGDARRVQRRVQDGQHRRSTASSTSCRSTTTRGASTTGRACSRTNGYEIPATWDEFKALLDQMQADGIGRRWRRPTTATGRRWACSTCSTCASTATTSTSR